MKGKSKRTEIPQSLEVDTVKPETPSPGPTPVAPQTLGSTSSGGQPDGDAVCELAYRLYEERGRVDGFDLQDWMEAEAIIRERGKLAA